MNNKNTLRKSISAIICIILILGCFGISAFADTAPEVSVFVDGKQIEFDVNPIIEDGRTLVPMRFIFEALNAKVEWISDTQTAVGYKDGTKIEISIAKKEMLRNGETIVLDVPAKLIGGRTLVPVRAVSEGLGAKVEWDAALYMVKITSGTTDALQNSSGSYHYTELSSEDLEILHSLYGEFRYIMEQTSIPQLFLSYPKTTIEKIESKDSKFNEAICENWDATLARAVMDIQVDSETNYDVLFGKPDELEKGYRNLLKKYGYSAEQVFDFSFVTTPKGKNSLLIEFKDTVKDENNPVLITSKYVAAVTDKYKVKYYTLEYSPLSDVYMICEINTDLRANHGVSGDSKEEFLSGIDKVFDK